MSLRANRIIKIVKPLNPAKEMTQLHLGFTALLSCHGKTYKHFRSLSGGSKGSTERRFSPSTVFRRAEAEGIAKLEDWTLTEPSPPSRGGAPREKTVSNSPPDKSKSILPALKDVCKCIVANGVDPAKPGIYAWKIEGIGTYVGKYTHKSRPLGEYNKNVGRIHSGESYRPKKPDGFRRIHRALAQAIAEGLCVELHYVENCSLEKLDTRERYLIASMASGELNG